MPNEVFLDTAYIVALASPDDQLHTPTRLLRNRIKAPMMRLVTTRAVLLEIGNTLSRQRFRQGAITLSEAFEVDPNTEIVPLSEELYARAFALYKSRADKEWGLVDCISFVVMQVRGISDALTADEHFTQACFRALLREAT